MKYLSQPHRLLRHTPTLPFIYGTGIFIILLDIFIELYHRVSFPFYSIPYVSRGQYIKIDRQKLSYLGLMQKLNCMYCGYANGVVKYWARIIGETEKYWCGIQHEKTEGFHQPDHHDGFIPYGDRPAYEETYLKNRKPRI